MTDLQRKTRGWWAVEGGKFVVRDYEGRVVVFEPDQYANMTLALVKLMKEGKDGQTHK